MRRFDCELKEDCEAAISLVSHNRRVEIENTLSPEWGVVSTPLEETLCLLHVQFSTLDSKMLSNRAHHRENASMRSRLLVEEEKLSPCF
jgi:hypothetical protein